MEDIEIEYLDEYKDLVLPGIKTNCDGGRSATASTSDQASLRMLQVRRISSDSSGSSSIDPDIFQKLFDGKFLDDELLNESGSNAKGRSRRRLSSSSSDCSDALDALYNRKSSKNKIKRRDRLLSYDSIDDLGDALMGSHSKLSQPRSTGSQLSSKKLPSDILHRGSNVTKLKTSDNKLHIGKPSSSAISNSKSYAEKFMHGPRANGSGSSSGSSNVPPTAIKKKKAVTIIKAKKPDLKPSKHEPKKDPLHLQELSDELDSDSSFEYESDFYGEDDTEEDEVGHSKQVIDISTDTSRTTSVADTVTPVVSEDECQQEQHTPVDNNERLQLYLNNLNIAETPPSKQKYTNSSNKSCSNEKTDSTSPLSTHEQVNDSAEQALAEAEKQFDGPSNNSDRRRLIDESDKFSPADYVDVNLTYETLERLSLNLAEQIINIDTERSIEFQKRSGSKPRSDSSSKLAAPTIGLPLYSSHVRKLTYSNESLDKAETKQNELRRVQSDGAVSKRGRGRPSKIRAATTEEQSKSSQSSPKKEIASNKLEITKEIEMITESAAKLLKLKGNPVKKRKNRLSKKISTTKPVLENSTDKSINYPPQIDNQDDSKFENKNRIEETVHKTRAETGPADLGSQEECDLLCVATEEPKIEVTTGIEKIATNDPATVTTDLGNTDNSITAVLYYQIGASNESFTSACEVPSIPQSPSAKEDQAKTNWNGSNELGPINEGMNLGKRGVPEETEKMAIEVNVQQCVNIEKCYNETSDMECIHKKYVEYKEIDIQTLNATEIEFKSSTNDNLESAEMLRVHKEVEEGERTEQHIQEDTDETKRLEEISKCVFKENIEIPVTELSEQIMDEKVTLSTFADEPLEVKVGHTSIENDQASTESCSEEKTSKCTEKEESEIIKQIKQNDETKMAEAIGAIADDRIQGDLTPTFNSKILLDTQLTIVEATAKKFSRPDSTEGTRKLLRSAMISPVPENLPTEILTGRQSRMSKRRNRGDINKLVTAEFKRRSSPRLIDNSPVESVSPGNSKGALKDKKQKKVANFEALKMEKKVETVKKRKTRITKVAKPAQAELSTEKSLQNLEPFETVPENKSKESVSENSSKQNQTETTTESNENSDKYLSQKKETLETTSESNEKSDEFLTETKSKHKLNTEISSNESESENKSSILISETIHEINKESPSSIANQALPFTSDNQPTNTSDNKTPSKVRKIRKRVRKFYFTKTAWTKRKTRSKLVNSPSISSQNQFTESTLDSESVQDIKNESDLSADKSTCEDQLTFSTEITNNLKDSMTESIIVETNPITDILKKHDIGSMKSVGEISRCDDISKFSPTTTEVKDNKIACKVEYTVDTLREEFSATEPTPKCEEPAKVKPRALAREILHLLNKAKELGAIEPFEGRGRSTRSRMGTPDIATSRRSREKDPTEYSVNDNKKKSQTATVTTCIEAAKPSPNHNLSNDRSNSMQEETIKTPRSEESVRSDHETTLLMADASNELKLEKTNTDTEESNKTESLGGEYINFISNTDSAPKYSDLQSFVQPISLNKGRITPTNISPSVSSTPSTCSSTNSCRKVRVLVKKTIPSSKNILHFEKFEDAQEEEGPITTACTQKLADNNPNVSTEEVQLVLENEAALSVDRTEQENINLTESSTVVAECVKEIKVAENSLPPVPEEEDFNGQSSKQSQKTDTAKDILINTEPVVDQLENKTDILSSQDHLDMENAEKDQQPGDKDKVNEPESDFNSTPSSSETTGVTEAINFDSVYDGNSDIVISKRLLRKREADTFRPYAAKRKTISQVKQGHASISGSNTMAPPAPPRRGLSTGKAVMRRLAQPMQVEIQPTQKRRKLKNTYVNHEPSSRYISIVSKLNSESSSTLKGGGESGAKAATRISISTSGKRSSAQKQSRLSLPQESTKSISHTGTMLSRQPEVQKSSPTKSALSTLLSSDDPVAVDNSVIITKTPITTSTEAFKKIETPLTGATGINISVSLVPDAKKQATSPPKKIMSQAETVKKMFSAVLAAKESSSSSPSADADAEQLLPVADTGKRVKQRKQKPASSTSKKRVSLPAKISAPQAESSNLVVSGTVKKPLCQSQLEKDKKLDTKPAGNSEAVKNPQEKRKSLTQTKRKKLEPAATTIATKSSKEKSKSTEFSPADKLQQKKLDNKMELRKVAGKSQEKTMPKESLVISADPATAPAATVNSASRDSHERTKQRSSRMIQSLLPSSVVATPIKRCSSQSRSAVATPTITPQSKIEKQLEQQSLLKINERQPTKRLSRKSQKLVDNEAQIQAQVLGRVQDPPVLASHSRKRKLPATSVAEPVVVKRPKEQAEQPTATIAFPVRITAASTVTVSQQNLPASTPDTQQLQSLAPTAVQVQGPKEMQLPLQLPLKLRKLRVRLNRRVTKTWLEALQQNQQPDKRSPLHRPITPISQYETVSSTQTEHVINKEPSIVQRTFHKETTAKSVKQPVPLPVPLPVVEVKVEEEVQTPILPQAAVAEPMNQTEVNIAHPPVLPSRTPISSTISNSSPADAIRVVLLPNNSNNNNSSSTIPRASNSVDLHTFGTTKMFSFLYPSRFQRSYGNVGLDFCCPNLDGPMQAIDPTRLHSKQEVPVLELPQYIVISTKIISKQDKNIPNKVRAKLEQLAAKDGLPCAMQTIQNTTDSIVTPGKPLSATPAPNMAPSLPNIDRLSKKLPRGTTLTKKVQPSISEVLTPTLTEVSSPSMTKLTPGLLQLPSICPTDKLRVELQTRVQHFDGVLQNLARRASSMSVSERQLVIDNIVRTSTLLPIDVDVGTKLLENYVYHLNEVTKPISAPLQQLRSTVTPHTSTSTATTQSPSNNNSVLSQALSATSDARDNTPSPLTTRQRQQATAPINHTHSTTASKPIYDKDKNIIGYQYKTPRLALPTTPHNSLPTVRKSLPVVGSATPCATGTQQQNTGIQKNTINAKPSAVSSVTSPTGAVRAKKRVGSGIALPFNPSAAQRTYIHDTKTLQFPVSTDAPIEVATGSVVDILRSSTTNVAGTTDNGSKGNVFIINQVLSQPEECILPDAVSRTDTALEADIKGEVEDAEILT